MKSLPLALCLTSLLFAVARAGNDAPTVELKSKSTFNAAPNDRDPFWPIGWRKPGPRIAGTGPAITPGAFALTSITMGSGQHFAILNGRVMQEGQQFGLQYGNQIYNVTLHRIGDGQVTVVYQGNEIVVPLRRK